MKIVPRLGIAIQCGLAWSLIDRDAISVLSKVLGPNHIWTFDIHSDLIAPLGTNRIEPLYYLYYNSSPCRHSLVVGVRVLPGFTEGLALSRSPFVVPSVKPRRTVCA